MRLVVAGGGTGGHIYAGVAIAQELLKQEPQSEILFVGSAYGLETKLVPKSGFKLETVKLGKLVGQSPFRKIFTLFQIPIAILKCVFILRKFKADAVIGVGGYAAGPCVMAAKILSVPIGVLEQNAVMGFTNLLAAKFSNIVFTAFDETPAGVDGKKCLFTGSPSRGQIQAKEKNKKERFTIFIFGGSQGAKGINRMMLEAAEELLPLKNELEIIHQTGERDFEMVKSGYEHIGMPAEVHAFIYDMERLYQKADLIICRAGSGTISELGATQNAAIFIPFPFAAGDHQAKNAELIERSDAGVMVKETTDKVLAKKILELKNNTEKLSRMRVNIKKFHKPNSAPLIIEALKKLTHPHV